ncbi:MAG: ABC transporter ATP-binding protein [Firmicutes bacterium]|nr:ABC transporter ATP-binding protein [Bacillota bacterium]
MLVVEDLTVSYGYKSALREVTFEVKQNEIVSLIGSNGAGKTTTLMTISGLVEKEKGTIYYKDQNITGMPSHQIVKHGVCHIPEGRNIFPQLTVAENLMMGTLGNTSMKKAQINDQLDEMYSLFPRLKERRLQAGGTLSGGEQQMLAIARGLMPDPALVMLDEPSLGLAPIIVEEIFRLILRIKASGKTILLIEQNATLALQVADRGYVLERGEIVLTGTGQELLVNPEVKKAYLGI